MMEYPLDRVAGEKRLLTEIADSSDFVHAIPIEKRSNSLLPMQPAIANNLMTMTKSTNERGEKRSASQALNVQPRKLSFKIGLEKMKLTRDFPSAVVKDNSIGEQQEREIIKRVTTRVLSLPREAANAPLTVFHGVNEPSIAFQTYVERLVHYANVWAREKPNVNSQGIRCALLAIIYLERTKTQISSRSVHRLFLIAFLIGIKLTDDFGISNTFWGRAGGCTLEDVNRMELAFCATLSWDFGVNPNDFEAIKRVFAEGI